METSKNILKNSCLFRMVMRIMVLVALLGHSSVANSQYGVTYPVDINAMLTPPYGTCLTDYVGTNRFQCNVLMRDMHATGYKFRILMTVKDMASGRVMFSAQSDQHTVTPGKPVYMAETGVFSEFFKAGNILSSTAYRDGCLNEGAYNFVFQVVDDNDKRRIPISKECVFPARLQAGGAPLLISPFTGTNIECGQTFVNFTWQMPIVTGEQTKYLIEICPTDDGGNGLHYLGSYTPSANGSGPSQGYIHATSYMPMYQLIETEGKKLVPNTTYFWRVSIIDELGNVKPNSTSEIDSFTYCYTKELEPYTPLKEPKVKAINGELDTVHIDTVKTEDNATNAYWFLDDVRFKYQSYALDIRKKSQDTWTTYHIKINEGDTEEKNYYKLANLKYNEPYEARMQYLLITDNDTSYAPFSDTITFVVPNPMDTADCGEIMAIKDCNGEKGRILKKYDTLYANGTPVVLDSIVYKAGDSTVISGYGVISFPILKNFKLKMSFNEVSVNCYGELVSGQVVSVYKESTGAIIDLNHLTGKGDGGGSQSTTERPDPTNYKDKDEAKEKMQTGDYAQIGDSLYTKDKDGNLVALGKPLTIPADNYTNNNTLDDDDVYCIFRNDTKDAPFIGFDADEHKYYRGRPTLGDHYTPTFSKQDGADFEYIIPYVASNPGRVVKLSATLEGRLTDEYNKDSVKFIMPLSGGNYLALNAKKEGDKFIVDFPGGKNPDTNSDVYAIVKKGEKYVNVGKINIETYAWRTQKVKFVPVVNDYGVDEKAISETLNRIYGRFGITYEVTKDDRFESENINSEFLNNFSVSSGTFTKQSDDMKRLQYYYKTERGIQDSTAYIFLLKSAVDYPAIDGDMPQGQICGYIFMHSDNGTLSDGRLVAHELAHGIYRLDHVFEKAYGIPENSTDNLLDYNNGDQLAHFQWELIKKPGFAWVLLESDEDNMAIPPCLIEAATNLFASTIMGGIADYAINQVWGSDTEKEKPIGEYFVDQLSISGTVKTVLESCITKFPNLINILTNAGSSAVEYFECRDNGGRFCNCAVNAVVKTILNIAVDKLSGVLSDKILRKKQDKNNKDKDIYEIADKAAHSMLWLLDIHDDKIQTTFSSVIKSLVEGSVGGIVGASASKPLNALCEKASEFACGQKNTDYSSILENFIIDIDRENLILHVYLYTSLGEDQLNKVEAVVESEAMTVSETDPCSIGSSETLPEQKYTLEADYNKLPSPSWWSSFTGSYIEDLKYEEKLSRKAPDPDDSSKEIDIKAFVYKNKFADVNNLESNKLCLYEFGYLAKDVEGAINFALNWLRDKKVLDSKVYHYVAKLPCDKNVIYGARVTAKALVKGSNGNYEERTDNDDYHCGKSIPDCREKDDDNGDDIVNEPIVEEHPVTKNDNCSGTNLFKATKIGEANAIAAANANRIKAECKFGLPKCSKWVKDSDNKNVYHITSSAIKCEKSESVENLFTVTLSDLSNPFVGDVELNQEVAEKYLGYVFEYESKCGENQVLCHENPADLTSKIKMMPISEYRKEIFNFDFAIRVFVEISYRWIKDARANSSIRNEQVPNILKTIVKKYGDEGRDYFFKSENTKSIVTWLTAFDKNKQEEKARKRIEQKLKEMQSLDVCINCETIANLYSLVANALYDVNYIIYKESYTNPSSDIYLFEGLMGDLVKPTDYMYTSVAFEPRNEQYGNNAEAENMERIAEHSKAISAFLAKISKSAIGIGNGLSLRHGAFLVRDGIATYPTMSIDVNSNYCK